MADIKNGAVTITGLSEFEAKLQKLKTDNPDFEKRLRGAIRKVLGEVRAKMQSNAQSGLQMQSDPRKAYKAVKTAVYRQILGGSVSILNKRGTKFDNYEPPRKGVSGRGGNRRTRSGRTRQIMGYAPLDRGFILRWINDGTPGARNIEFTPNDRRKVDKWNKHPNTGNRGNISARNFFRGAGERALAQAADNLATLIDTELEAMLNKKK